MIAVAPVALEPVEGVAGRRRALWLCVRLTASEKASDSCEKAPARWLSAGRRISLGKLFLERADSSLSVGHSLLHHEKALDQHVRSRRNLSDLAPDQLISFGIFALAAGLAEPIEQTGYEITFFGCHSLRKTLFSTLTSLEAVSVPGVSCQRGRGETCWSVGVLDLDGRLERSGDEGRER